MQWCAENQLMIKKSWKKQLKVFFLLPPPPPFHLIEESVDRLMARTKQRLWFQRLFIHLCFSWKGFETHDRGEIRCTDNREREREMEGGRRRRRRRRKGVGRDNCQWLYMATLIVRINSTNGNSKNVCKNTTKPKTNRIKNRNQRIIQICNWKKRTIQREREREEEIRNQDERRTHTHEG